MKKIGLQPIPMMDRDKKDEVPQGQVRPACLPFCLSPGSFSQDPTQRDSHFCIRKVYRIKTIGKLDLTVSHFRKEK